MSVKWVNGSSADGNPAPDAVALGTDAYDDVLYIGSVLHEDKRYLCIINPAKKLTYVRVDGVNHLKHFFRYLIAKETSWVLMENAIPANAVVVNVENSVQPSYIIRARSNDSWIVTTITENFETHADFYGEEMLITECEILISNEYL